MPVEIRMLRCTELFLETDSRRLGGARGLNGLEHQLGDEEKSFDRVGTQYTFGIRVNLG